MYFIFAQLIQFSLFISIFLFQSIPNIYAQSTKDQPDQVIILFRHGSRGPTSNIYDPSWPTYLLGELTPTGMRQHFYLGTQLREKYSYLIPEYNPDNFYVRSTELNRTIMSAESFFLGFFPFGTGPNITNLSSEFDTPPYNISNSVKTKIEALGSIALPFNYRPVPIHVVEEEEDYLLYSFSPEACPLVTTMQASAEQNEEEIQFQILMNSTLNLIINLTNTTSFNLTNLGTLWDTLHCDIYAGKQIPSDYAEIQSNSNLWRNLTFIHNYLFFYTNAGSLQQIQLFSMNYFNDVMGFMYKFSQGLQTPKLLIYSASDTTMVPLLTALNITNTSCLMSNFLNETNITSCVAPDFASQLIIEFYNNTGTDQSEVAVYYNDYLQNICNTESGRCLMNSFFEVLKGITQDQGFDYYTQQCNSIVNETEPNNVNLEIMRNSMIGIACFIGCALFVIVAYQKKILKKKKESFINYEDFLTQNI